LTDELKKIIDGVISKDKIYPGVYAGFKEVTITTPPITVPEFEGLISVDKKKNTDLYKETIKLVEAIK
jgi:hypothetical protein